MSLTDKTMLVTVDGPIASQTFPIYRQSPLLFLYISSFPHIVLYLPTLFMICTHAFVMIRAEILIPKISCDITSFPVYNTKSLKILKG
jgi:hypothetical protein